MSAQGPDCVKTQTLKRDENDILEFDSKVECTCDMGTQNGLERRTCPMVIDRLQPRSNPDILLGNRTSA
jgi:hypothetical protein